MKFSCVILTGAFLAGAASAFQPTRPGFCPANAARPARAAPRAMIGNAVMGTAGIDIREGAQRDVVSMDEWAAQYGVQKGPGVQLTSEDGMDWSLFTSENLPAGTPVMFVPGGMLLSSFGAAQELGGIMDKGENRLADARIGEQIPLFRLVVKILAEYEKGEQSPFFPWLNSLPRLYSNGASMTFACFDLLPPYVAWLSMKEKTNVKNFEKALKYVQLSPETVQDENLVKWAYNVAVTRSIEVNGERVIAPMADMFNHGTETEVEIQFDQEGNCVAYATRDVPAGSPLRVSLGDPRDPSPLFATYGFLDETSPATFCKTMDLLKEMEQLGMQFSDLLFYKDTGDISPQVYDIFLYSVLSADPNLQQQFYQAYMNGDEGTKQQFHQEYFQYTKEALQNHVGGVLQELDRLSADAMTKDPNRYPRLPVILKHNEFVKETFLRVKANLDAM